MLTVMLIICFVKRDLYLICFKSLMSNKWKVLFQLNNTNIVLFECSEWKYNQLKIHFNANDLGFREG